MNKKAAKVIKAFVNRVNKLNEQTQQPPLSEQKVKRLYVKTSHRQKLLVRQNMEKA